MLVCAERRSREAGMLDTIKRFQVSGFRNVVEGVYDPAHGSRCTV
jgi:hypothetical protein